MMAGEVLQKQLMNLEAVEPSGVFRPSISGEVGVAWDSVSLLRDEDGAMRGYGLGGVRLWMCGVGCGGFGLRYF